MTTAKAEDLKRSCPELENKCRLLSSWLRERDNECRTSLNGESKALKELADQLQQWIRANERNQAAAPSTPLASQ